MSPVPTNQMLSALLYPFLGALAASLAAGAPLIRLLGRLRARQFISADAPERHQEKAGTPTMGGLLILGAAVLAGIAAGRSNPMVLAVIALTVAFAAIGFLDDYLIVSRGRSLGLKARHKLAAQFLVAILFVAWHHGVYPAAAGGDERGLLWLWASFQVLLIVGMSNAVNLTDGLDGLAAGVSLPVWIVLAVLAAGAMGQPAVGGLCAAFAGATLGYLWFNAHPAKVFMGDTGSLPIGAAMAAAAIAIGQEWLLLLAAGVHVLEAGSVTLQVVSFKTTGRRIFRMSPIHHHFELAGWPESQVVTRFTIVSVAFCALSLWAVLLAL